MTLIAVSMGSKTSKDRFNTCRALLDYGFSGWKLVVPDISDSDITYIDVINGKKKSVAIKVESDISSVLIPSNSSSKIETKVEMEDFIEAPVEKCTCVGRLSVLFDGQEISSSRIVTDDKVEKVDFNFLMFLMMQDFFLSKRNIM